MPNNTSKRGEQPLSSIIGEQLSSVEFVQDYVQLRFDGPYLTAITWPTVYVEGVKYVLGMPNYRDMLCELIGKIVGMATVVEHEEIRIEFADGSSLSISLRPEDHRSDEAAIFHNGPEEWLVW